MGTSEDHGTSSRHYRETYMIYHATPNFDFLIFKGKNLKIQKHNFSRKDEKIFKRGPQDPQKQIDSLLA